MEKELLGIINTELSKFLTYEYGEYTGTLTYPYAVGENYENDYTFEDGSTGGEFILTIFNRGTESDLITLKEKVKSVFKDFRKQMTNGLVYINYRSKLFIRTGEADLKKLEIYLDTKVWEGE